MLLKPAFSFSEFGSPRSRRYFFIWPPQISLSLNIRLVFPGCSGVKNPSASAGGMGLILGLRRSPGEGNGSPLQYSCLGSSMDRGATKQQQNVRLPSTGLIATSLATPTPVAFLQERRLVEREVAKILKYFNAQKY